MLWVFSVENHLVQNINRLSLPLDYQSCQQRRSRSRKRKRIKAFNNYLVKIKPTESEAEHWFCLCLRRFTCNMIKWKRSDSSDSDSVEHDSGFRFSLVISSLIMSPTATATPSLVKTSLKKGMHRSSERTDYQVEFKLNEGGNRRSESFHWALPSPSATPPDLYLARTRPVSIQTFSNISSSVYRLANLCACHAIFLPHEEENCVTTAKNVCVGSA